MAVSGVIWRLSAADGWDFVEGLDNYLAHVADPIVEVVVVFVKAAEVVVAVMVGEGLGCELVAGGVVVEEQVFVFVVIELFEGCFEVTGGIGDVKIWQSVVGVL